MGIDRRRRKKAVLDIFEASNGIMFEHGFDALRNGRFRVREFEQAFAKKLGYRYCQAVTSGTAGLLVALKAIGIKPGDEVITQSFTFIATLEAIIECGATPVIVDIDESLTMDTDALKAAITDKTKAIIPVHMLGSPARMENIMEIAHEHGLYVIEDACEILGGSYKSKPIGCLSHATVYSLDGGKTITCGEGGMVATNDLNIYTFCKEYVDHGHQFYPGLPKGRDKARFTGFNYRLTEMQAAYASAQLEKLDYIVNKNRENMKKLKEKIGLGVRYRYSHDVVGDIDDTLILLLDNKQTADRLISVLAEEKMATKILPDAADWHFIPNMPQFLNGHPIYKNDHWMRWKKSKQIVERCVALPITVKMTDEVMDKYADAVRKAIHEK